MNYITDFSLPDKELLLALINHDNDTKIIPEQIEYSTPRQYGSNPLGTEVTVTVNDRITGEFKYSIAVNYVRVTPHKLFSITGLILPTSVNINSTEEALRAINYKYGVNLNSSLCRIVPGDANTFTLEMLDNHLIYTGSIIGELIDTNSYDHAFGIIYLHPNRHRTIKSLDYSGSVVSLVDAHDTALSASPAGGHEIHGYRARTINSIAVSSGCNSNVLDLIIGIKCSLNNEVLTTGARERVINSVKVSPTALGGVDDISVVTRSYPAGAINLAVSRDRTLSSYQVDGFSYVLVERI